MPYLLVSSNTNYSMKKHHTKDKGDLGVLKAQVDLAEKGWLSLHPQTEHAPFDLVAYKDGKFKRIQVKYRSTSKLGNLSIKFKTYWCNTKRMNVIDQDKSEVDVLCVYCPELDKCCYISMTDIPKQYITLRVKIPKNNQKINVRMFNDYYQVP